MSIAYFPRLYEDELLFSVFSRFYRHGGYLSFKDAAKELFMNPKIRVEKEFVKNLKPEIIELLTQDITLDNLLEKHTMLVKEKGVNYGVENLDNAKSIVNMMNAVTELNKKAEEHIYLIGVNSKNKVVGVFLISKGTINQCIVSPREIFIRLLLVGAVHFMVCHNHPSKDCTPSREDIVFTSRLKEAGLLLNVPLVDHIIIGGDWYYSFKEQETL